MGSSSVKTVEGNPSLASADPENEKETFSNQFATTRDDGIPSSHASVEASKSREDPSPILCSPSRKEDKAPVSEDVESNKTIISLNQVPRGKQESISENDLQLVKGESEQTEVDKLKSALPNEDNPLAETSPNDNKITYCRTVGEENVILKVSAEADPNDKEISFYPVEREENVLFKAEATASKPGDEDDSHESAESCSSTGLFLTRKRSLGYREKLVCDEKRLKNENRGNPESTFPHPRNSSFVSWISNMMKGVCKANPDEAPSALTVRPHHENDQSVDLHGTNQESGSIAGFEGIFKAMYCPTVSTRGTRILPLDHTPEEVSKELELANKTCSDSSPPVASGENSSKLKDISSGDERLYLGQFGSNEDPSCMPDIVSKNVTVYLDNSPGFAEINSSFNIPSGHGTSGSKSSISLQVESDSSSQGKEAKIFCFTNPNKSLHNVTSMSGSLGNLWISRFLPKASGNIINPPPCDHDVFTVFEGSSNSVRLLPQPFSCGPFVKDQTMFEGSRKACTEEQVDVACRRMQNNAANGARSFGLLKITEHIDQKSKPKLNLIQNSQISKGSEAMASVFARRLDAFRNIKPSEKSGNIANMTTTCFFCGANGHDLRNCSKITETEIEGFVQKAHSFDGAGELSCYCIRCFQLNHWAIACPNTLLRKRSHSDSCCFPDFKKQLNISTNIDLSDKEEKILVEMNTGECSVARTVYVGKKPRVSSEMVKDTECKEKLINNNTKEFKSGLHQMKNILSSFKNEASEGQVGALCNFVNRQIPAVPRETFEAIKKLRLSRTDVLKWMKSPASLFGLEGFFLRLRLKKLEGLDGSGYYVACVNGAAGKRLEGVEVPLSVNIGGFKCLVESRFVSNHEFVEDELMAWWRAILKSGNELPSEADLKMKLQVRKIYGF
ncbi:hypothetical protein Scep_029915 [Stephania cephalantha]|uniref:Plus3 domain-containing protein n=1 Tax=Stephania cephalantha TaxID=152367 RepID=A0AAP0HDW8_9MAGN